MLKVNKLMLKVNKIDWITIYLLQAWFWRSCEIHICISCIQKKTKNNFYNNNI